MTDTRLICAEMRAGELLVSLQAAVDGNPHWRPRATTLLREINDLVLPPRAIVTLREVDARKRAAEIMNDACND